MSTIKLDKISKFILDYYKYPIKEKFELPRKKKTITKKITVDKPVEKEVVTSSINPIPGIGIIILGIIIGTILFPNNQLISIIVFSLSIVGGGIAFFLIKKKKTIKKTVTEKAEKEIEEEIELPVEYDYRTIPQKYSIKSIGRVNLKFHLARIKGNNLIIPDSDVVFKNKFKYPTIEKLKSFKKEDAEIEDQTESIPYVLDGNSEEQPLDIDTTYGKKVILRGYEKNLNRYFQNTEDTFSKIKKSKFEIPIIQDNDILKYFVKYKTKQDLLYSDEINSLIHSEQGIELEEFMEMWKEQWTSRMQLMNKVRINSLQNEVSPEFFELGQLSQYTSFNFYCPDCNEEIQKDILSRDYSVQGDSPDNEIYFSKNTKCKFDPAGNLWICPVCGNAFRQPIPIHKVMDEIFMPVYDNLMEENKVVREKHHSETRKREIEMRYKMKEELEKIFFDHITGIFELQSSMDKMQVEIEGESEAIVYMEDVSRKQKDIHSDVINNILRENTEIKRDIAIQTERVTRQMEDFKNAEMNDYAKEMDVLSRAKRIEDERRHQQIHGTLQNIDSSVKENTEVSRKGFENVTSAVNENTEVSREGFKNVTSAVNENTEVTRKGFKKSNKYQKRNNAIHIAMAKKQGIELRDESWFRIDKKLSYLASDFTGAVTGRSIIDTEVAKEN